MNKRSFALLLSLLFAIHISATIGTWHTYMAYGEITEISAATTEVFVLSSGDLFSFNPNDESITEYNKVNGLSDVNISHIMWNKSAKYLVVIYKNSNIDLINENADIINISALLNKTMIEDKTINSIYNDGYHAYLSTNFGIIKLNVRDAEISETYNLNYAIKQTAVSGGNIYARLFDGSVLCASLKSNLLDKAVWKITSVYDPAIFDVSKQDWDKWYPKVSTLSLDAPRHNNFGFMKILQGKLYTCGGGFKATVDMTRPGTIQVREVDGKWTFFEDHLDTITGYAFIDVNSLDIDPFDASHIFASGRTGIYEYVDGRFVKAYNIDNSPLQIAATVGGNHKEYVLVQALKYDLNGNLWCFNSVAPSQSLIQYDKKSNKWTSHHHQELMCNPTYSLANVSYMCMDSRGYIWFCNNHWDVPSLYYYDPTTDKLRSFKRFVNEDGTELTLTSVNYIVEDADGNMWIGTSAGPLLLNQEQFDTTNPIFEQVKVPRLDGSGLADYLLSGVSIIGIAIDGSGRKWFASETNGVYLISEDNYTQIYHFTKDNSPLLANEVESIVINDESGEVFFGTEAGLCSFMSDASKPQKELSKDNIWAYPNPVTPDYTGLITIVGLTKEAQVKIATSTGVIVAEGISNGGTFTWDGNDKKGRRVASGVYNVLISTAEGDDGVVCKVAIIK